MKEFIANHLWQTLWIAIGAYALCVALAYGQTLPESGDRVLIGDFEYVLVKSSDWARVTNNVETCITAWDKLHATESGRQALHGSRGHTTITNGTITVEYADGYKRTEAIKANAKPKRNKNPISNLQPSTSNLSPYQKRRAEILAKRRAALSKTNEVTVAVGGGAR